MEKIKVRPFAAIIGTELSIMPYISQNDIPVENSRYICRDIFLVCLSFITFITCGTNEAVVIVAAIYPIISIIINSN